MSLVVADTSPINYLLQIDAIELLPKLFGTILIPDAVSLEISRDQAPLAVRSWARALPEWVAVQSTKIQSDAALQSLDDGEQQAISLALAVGATTLLIDERRGTAVAKSLGLTTLGTLGVLAICHRRHWIDGYQALQSLITTTNFRVGDLVVSQYLSSLVNTHKSSF